MTTSKSAQHTPGPFAVESYGDSFEVVDEETLAVTVARLSGPRAKANAERIAACLNAFEGQPFGWYVELVHDDSGEVVRTGFQLTKPTEGPSEIVTGFTWRATPLAALAKAQEGGAA